MRGRALNNYKLAKRRIGVRAKKLRLLGIASQMQVGRNNTLLTLSCSLTVET